MLIVALKCSQKLAMSLEEEILEMARSGDGYAAVERSQLLVRRLKRSNQLTPAMLFLMRLAHTLADRGHWDAAVTAALRSIKLFPREATRMGSDLQDLFFLFANRAEPAAAGSDLFAYFDEMTLLFPGAGTALLRKKAMLCDAAGLFFEAQLAYTSVLALLPPDADRFIEYFAGMLWRWVFQIEDLEKQRVQSQFFFGRAALAVAMSTKEPCLGLAVKLMDAVAAHARLAGLDVWLDQPLVHFVRFFLRAVLQKSVSTTDFLREKYEQVLEVDRELRLMALRLTSRITRATQPPAGAGTFLQNLMGAIGQTAHPSERSDVT
jgi:hypothetical protein